MMTHMTKEMAEFLKEASENAGNECDIREGYSGRCMYGRETVGVVVDSATQLLADVLRYVSENANNPQVGDWGGGVMPESESGFSMDNMGRDRIIIY